MSARPRGTGALELRRTKAGQDVIYARFRVGGVQQRHRIGVLRKPGSTVGITRREAEAELRRLLETSSARQMERERVTVEEACRRYIADAEVKCKRATIVSYESITHRHMAPYFRGKTVDAVDEALVERWRDHLMAKVSPKTAANVMIFAGGVFRYAVRKKWAASNPLENVTKPESRRGKEIRFLSAEELEAVLRVVPIGTTIGRLDRVTILVAAQTGVRQGEQLALRWRDVDFSASVIRVRRSWGHGEFTTPKSARSSRATPMNQRVARELELAFQSSRWHNDDDLVFAHPTLGGVQDPSALRKRFKDYLKAAGIERRLTWHMLRNTFGTSMAAAGAPLRSLMEWMGHSNIQTTMIYADYSPDPSGGAAWAERAFAPAVAPGSTTVAQQELAAAI